MSKINELAEIVRNSPCSIIVKPSFIDYANTSGDVQVNLKVLDAYFRGYYDEHKELQELLRKRQVELDERVKLMPVEPDTNLDWIDTNDLIHRGIISGGNEVKFDNKENLRKYGVFGSPPITFPTYLMSRKSNVAFYGGNPGEQVIVVVDKPELLKRRSVFLDPESIYLHNNRWTRDKIGESFIIFGGIPKEAIKGFQLNGEYEEI